MRAAKAILSWASAWSGVRAVIARRLGVLGGHLGFMKRWCSMKRDLARSRAATVRLLEFLGDRAARRSLPTSWASRP
jgi:hypothetical protein